MRYSELDISGIRPTERFAFVEAAARQWAWIQPIKNQDEYEVTWRMWELDRLIVSESHCSPTRFDRISKRHNSYDNEFVLVQLYIHGSSELNVGEETVKSEQGSVYLIDKSRPFSSVALGAKTLGVLLPHEAIGYDPSIHPAVIPLPGLSPTGRVLVQALTDLPFRLERLDEADAKQLASELALIVRALLIEPDQSSEAKAIVRARRIAIENYIETRLAMADLGVSVLCANFGLSRASLYRHFPEAGGVASYIRRRRLSAAFAELRLREPTRGAIRDACDRWGFYDTAHFNRAFRKSFNLNPTEALNMPKPSLTLPTAPGQLLRSWQSAIHQRS